MRAVESRLRTVSEESDSLTFNNARLTKRVEVLQQALEEEKSKSASSSGGWFGSGAKAELAKVQAEMAILREELDIKIRENEALHMRIFETGQETGTIKEDLQERIAKLKSENKSTSDRLEELTHTHSTTVSKLAGENQTLQQRSEELSDTLLRTKSLMQQREHTMTQVQQELTSQLQTVSGVLTAKLPFNDTQHESFNRLNLPPHDAQNWSKRISLCADGTTLFKKFIGFWKEWSDAEHEKMLYLTRLSTDEATEPVRNLSRKLGAILPEFQDVFTKVVTSFSIYIASESFSVDSERAKSDLDTSVKSLVQLHERAALAFKARIEAENRLIKTFVNNESARTYNSSLADNWSASQASIETFASYVSIFLGSSSGTPSTSSPAPTNAQFALQRSIEVLQTLKSNLKERVSITQQLINVETSSDAFLTNDVKLINNRRLSSLSNASAMFDKIADLAAQYLLILQLPAQTTTIVRAAAVVHPEGLFSLEPLAAKSRAYLQRLHQLPSVTQHRSVPYADQLKHLEQITELSAQLKSKEMDFAALRQQLLQHASSADRVAHELKAAKDALTAKHTSLQDAMTEIAVLKTQLQTSQQLLAAQTALNSGNTPPSSIQHASHTLEPNPASGESGSSSTSPTAQTASDDLMNPTPLNPVSPPPAYDSITMMPSTVPSIADFLQSTGTSASKPPPTTTTTFNVDDLLAEFRTPPVTPTPEQPMAVPTPIKNPVESTPAANSDITASPLPSMTSPSPSLTSSSASTKKPWSMAVYSDIDVPGASTTTLELGDPDLDREAQLKRHYEQRVQQYQTKIDSTDRRNMELYQQMQDLERKLKDAIAQREDLKHDLEASVKRGASGMDELETTRANYDQQLKMLTEHMVGLSDKISLYEEQLSVLKNSTVRCGKCKAWNSIEWLMGEGKMGQRCSHGNHPSSFNYA